MNALMNIRVQVLSGAARAQIKQLEADLARLRSSSGGAGMAASGMTTGGITALSKWGNQIQWAGRQLQYNFTLPIALAGGAAAKFALDNEKAFTRVQKVYGDTSMSQKQMKGETDALRKSFELLSNQFGVSQADVTNIAADWAAAGASGVALAKATKLTIETMILGELDAAKATESLIAIQAQYGMSVDQLSKTIDTLNMVENQTGTSMAGLIDAMARSAGVARTYGVDVRHLAALTAALTPAAGSAAAAGNGLKTILTRLMVPTKAASELMAKMGINTQSAGWQSLNAVQRVEALAKSYNKQSDAQKAMIAKEAAGVFQINRFSVAMKDVTNKNGYYQKALNATASETANFSQKQKELNLVLNSSPQRLQIIWNMLKNAAIDVIQPLIPLLLSLATAVQTAVSWFSNMNPGIQKLVLVGLLLLALIGPLARYIGSVTVLFGLMAEAAKFAAIKMGILAVATKAEEEQVQRSRGGLVAFTKAIWGLALSPFTLIGNGLGFIAGRLFALMRLVAGAAIFGALRGWVVAAFTSTLVAARGGLVSLAGMFATGAMSAVSAFGTVLLAGMTRLATSLALATGIPLTQAMRASLVSMPSVIGPALANLYSMFVGAFAPIVGVVSRSFTVILAMTSRFAAAFIVPMLGSIYTVVAGWATASLGLWATMQSIWITGSVRLQLVMAAFWARIVAGAAFTRLGVLTIFRNLGVELLALHTRLLGWMTAAWVGISTAVSTVWRFGMVALTTIYNAAGAALVVITTTLGGWLTRAWAATGVAMTVAWEAVQVAMRAAWVATLAFMASPAILFRFVATVVSRIALIVPLLEALLPALQALGAAIIAALTSPWTYVVIAVFAILYAFRDKLGNFWKSLVALFHGQANGIATAFQPLTDYFSHIVDNIEKAFYRLPVGIQGAFRAVVNIVHAAAMKVYDLFSYFNPFAHHSPSLVESVQKGMAVVGQHHSKVADVGGTMSKAAGDVQTFKKATGSITPAPFAQQRTDLSKILPQALPEFDKLIADYNKLTVLGNQAAAAVKAQQTVVDRWKLSLDAANLALDGQQKKLDGLQKNLDTLNTAYDKHKTALDNFASAPIQGMKAMNDQIFANQMAQKGLQLQMLQWSQANGSITDMTNKMASLAGDIEKLRADATSLRQAGAGSDILGPIQAQIDAMQQQSNALSNTVTNSPMAAWQKQLDALNQQGQILDLQNSLQFDPLNKQIQDLANSTKELTFQQIIDGVTKEKAALAILQPQIVAATKAVADQTAVVNAATAARDVINARYDAESRKLDTLKKQYDLINTSIQDITTALNDMGTAAANALQKAAAAKPSAASAAFDAAAAGNFADVGGASQIGREGTAADQAKQIEDFNKQLAKDTKDMFGKFDMFGPIKDMWNKAWKWVKDNIAPTLGDLGKAVSDTWHNITGGMFSGAGNSGFVKGASRTFDEIGNIATKAFNGIVKVGKLFWPDLKRIFEVLVKAGMDIWTKIGPEIIRLGAVLGKLFVLLWPVIKVLAEIIGVTLLVALKLIADVIGHVLGPALTAVIGIIQSVLRVITGLLEFIVGVFIGALTNDWTLAWKGVGDVVVGTWNLIWNTISGVVGIIIGIVRGVVDAIIGLFKWLSDVLVGHSIIPDMVNMIIAVFNAMLAPLKIIWNAMWAGISWLWTGMVLPLFNVVAAAVRVFAAVFNWVWVNMIKPAWDALWAGIKWAWDHVGAPLLAGVKVYIQTWADIFKWIWTNVISPAWNAIWTGISWVWDHVAAPLFQRFKDGLNTWAHIFSDIWNKIIKPAWDAIWGGISAVWDKVGKPLFNKISDGIKGIMNSAIDAINTLIRGVNKVAGLIHINIGIGEIPHLATGGQIPFGKVGGGFKTNGPRAIVGEGNSAYPEYVIPTDPKYRSRAQALWSAAGGDLQLLAGGGILGGLADIGGAILGGAKNLARGAAAAAFTPFKNLASSALDKIPVDWVAGTGKKFLSEVYNWIKGVSDAGTDVGASQGSREDHARAVLQAARSMNLGPQGTIIGLITSLVESSLRNYANSNIPESMAIPHDAVGSDHYSAGIMQQQTGPFGNYWGSVPQVMNPLYASTRFFKEMLNKAPGWKGQPPGNVAQTVQVSAFPDRYAARLGEATALLKSIGGYQRGGILPGFANGGIANKPVAGVFGEAGREVLAPLTPLWNRLDRIEARQQQVLTPQSGGGKTELHFHGDLSFPNIRNDKDADDFIKHLEGLAG